MFSLTGLKQVQVTREYDAMDADELSLSVAEVITVHQEIDGITFCFGGPKMYSFFKSTIVQGY